MPCQAKFSLGCLFMPCHVHSFHLFYFINNCHVNFSCQAKFSLVPYVVKFLFNFQWIMMIVKCHVKFSIHWFFYYIMSGLSYDMWSLPLFSLDYKYMPCLALFYVDPILNGAFKLRNKIVQLGPLSIYRVSRHGLNMDQYIGRVDYISKDMICISPTYSINVYQMWMSEKTKNTQSKSTAM